MFDDALEKSLRRIVEGNQQARRAASDRASRLMDALISGDGDKYHETVNDIIDGATGNRKKDDEVLGEDGTPQPPDGSADGSGSQTETQ